MTAAGRNASREIRKVVSDAQAEACAFGSGPAGRPELPTGPGKGAIMLRREFRNSRWVCPDCRRIHWGFKRRECRNPDCPGRRRRRSRATRRAELQRDLVRDI